MSDVLILGGGIAGVSAAAHLAPHAAVTLVEAEPQLGYHATGRSAAVFLARYGNATVRRLNALSLPDLLAMPDILTPARMLLLARAGETMAFADEVRDQALNEISPAQARDLVGILNPGAIARAALGTEVYDIDTAALLDRFRKSALSSGARIDTAARVDTISRAKGRWTVRAGARSWQAPVLVNATGAWADPVAGLAGLAPLGIQPFRRSIARVAVPGGADAAGWPMIDGVGGRFYAKPDAGALLVSPADEDPVPPHDAWAEPETLARGIAALDELTNTPVTRMLANWAGLRSFAPDRTPVIGADPEMPDFLWLAGQGGYGFQTCCAAARVLTDLVLGRVPALDAATLAALSPARFR